MEYTVKVNKSDKAGLTCLHYCAIRNLDDMAVLLLTNIANKDGRRLSRKRVV